MACALVSTARAQWLPNGNPVCRVPESIGTVIGTSRIDCFTQCGGTFNLFWSDGRSGFGSIYQGALSDFALPPVGPGDVPGQLVRQADGFLEPVAAVVVPSLQPPVTQFPRTATILVWHESPPTGGQQVRAQRLDDDTDWGPDGVLVSGSTVGASSAAVAPDDSGGVFVVWTSIATGTGNTVTRLQRVDALGQIRFGADGIFLGPDTTRHTRAFIARDGLLGCYVARAARDSLSPLHQPVNVNAVYRFNGNGQPAAGWPSEGIRSGGGVVSGLVSGPFFLTFNGPWAPPPPFGVWVLKSDAVSLSDNSLAAAVRASWIGLDGVVPPAWAGPGLLAVSGREGDVLSAGAVLGPDHDLFVLAQSRTRLPVPSPTQEDLVLQRLSVAGGLAASWPAAGVVVCDAPGRQSQANMIAVGDGVLCAWKDERGSNGDIYASRLLGDGTRTVDWPANGLAVCDAPGMQFAPLLGNNLTGGAFIAWTDQRDLATHANDLYGQTVSGDARLDAGGVQAPRFALSPVRPNPTRGAVRFELESPVAARVTLEVFDVAGRLVHRAAALAPAGGSTLGWDLSSSSAGRVRPGLYLVRVRAAGQEAHTRMVVTD